MVRDACFRLWVLCVAAGDVGLGERAERQPPGATAGQRPARSDTQSGDCLGMIPSQFRKQNGQNKKDLTEYFGHFPQCFPLSFSVVHFWMISYISGENR